MPPSAPLELVSAATQDFVAAVQPRAPCRVEAKVSSHDGMPLLCAVEAVFRAALSRPAAQELVWLGGAPAAGLHVLHLQAYAVDNVLLHEAVHRFEA